jgi:hypothetical protein
MTASKSEQSSQRLHHSYDPFEDAAARFPDWDIRIIDLGGRCTELYVPGTKTAYLDIDAVAEDPEHAYAHAVAHMDYHLGELGDVMTPEQEAQANDVAHIRLDREGSR